MLATIMHARVDFEARRITASVRDLVWRSQPRVGATGLVPGLRAELGQDIHRRYRSERAGQPGFAAEVAVEVRRQIAGFAAVLSGRIDGLLGTSDDLVIEEVKSMIADGPALCAITAEDIPEHCLQVQCYALGLYQKDRQKGRPRAIHPRLRLVSVVDGSSRTMSLDFEPEAIALEVDRLLSAVVAEAEFLRQRAETRAACARALCMPYPSLRRHQDQLIATIAHGLNARRPVLVSAPTGIGKTVSALFPALGYALQNDAQIYYATAKVTQRQLVADTFSAIADASGLPRGALTAVTMRAKEQMCPPGHLVCHPEHCSYIDRFAARAEATGAVDTLCAEGAHVGADRIYQLGLAQTLCPFELSLRAAARAELVICDYNHVYQHASLPGVAKDVVIDAPGPETTRTETTRTEMTDREPAQPVVIVDEAHNLFDRARGYYSPFVSRAALSRIASGRANVDGAIADLCQRIVRHIDEAIECAGDDAPRTGGCISGPGAGGCDLAAWNAFASEAAQLALLYALAATASGALQAGDPVLELVRTIGLVKSGIAAREPEMVPYLATARAPSGPGIGVLCVNPAARLAERHRSAASTVAMSATLTPSSYFCDVLGLADLHPVIASLPSPFPAWNRRVVIVPSVTTTYRERAKSYRPIAELIGEITAVKPGRYAVFFPSFAFLTRVTPHLGAPILPRACQLFVQLPDMPQALRQKIIEGFRRSRGPALLCAVMGGAFAEGIDFPGDELIGAIVVGPGLPAVGFERAEMQRYFDERADSGFAYAMLYPGMQRVVQSAGRVIRTMADRGIIALLGRRFAEPAYAECLPADWYQYDPRELVTDDPAAELADFWAQPGQAG